MFQAFYTGLSGMFSFSQNLDSVSNNISNMNTPGYRGTDTFYRSLTSSGAEQGVGTQISGLGYRFSSGDIRQTGNSSDLAIAGQGMFVLKNGEQYLYTRAGQFTFNDSGVLVDRVSGFEVLSLDKSGQVMPIDISEYRALAPEATTAVNFSGNLSPTESEHTIEGLTIINALGEEVVVSAKFTNNSSATPGSWNVEILDGDNQAIGSGEIRFGSDGTPVNDFSSFDVSVKDSLDGSATVSMNFGTSGNFSGATSIGSSTSIAGNIADGSPISSLSRVSFNADGTLQFTYSNGVTKEGPALALANFANDTALELESGSLFRASDISSRKIGQAGSEGLGSIVAESIELSNVDLSKEFADMIVIQRGYQASSRVLNVANQMLEQLYESTRGR